MKSVIERLDDIENTARSIVAKAEEDKSQVEQEIQAQRDQFDKELDEKTQAELTRIREDGKRQVDELLKSQREKNHEAVQTLEKEYEMAHAVYAEGILCNIRCQWEREARSKPQVSEFQTFQKEI